nr:hypothetical protein [uncultured Mediterranean phage uvMED]
MSRIQVDNIFDKVGAGAPTFPAGSVVTGVSTATSFSGNLTGNVTGTASEASAAKSGSALETSINGKTSPGKAIALSMVFG